MILILMGWVIAVVSAGQGVHDGSQRSPGVGQYPGADSLRQLNGAKISGLVSPGHFPL